MGSRTLPKGVIGIAPVADAFAGTVSTDIVSMRNHKRVAFLVQKGVGATGTSTITVEACDDVSASNTSAVEFSYQAITSGDTPGDVTKATASGFTTTAGSNQLYWVWVDSAVLGEVGYEYVRLTAVEVVNSPVVGAVAIIMDESRDSRNVPATAIV